MWRWELSVFQGRLSTLEVMDDVADYSVNRYGSVQSAFT